MGGPVIQQGGGVAADDSITNAKLANMAQATIKGRQSGGGTGDPEDLTATQARTAMGLGTAATQNTGTSGANVPLMNGANSWSANQTFATAVDSATVATFTSTEAGANAGPYTDWIRDSASPANNDAIGIIRFIGRTSAAAQTAYSLLVANAKTVTAGAENGQFRVLNLVAGAQQTVMDIQAGMLLGAPTGGDKGLGSLNAKDVYNDNVALTCMATQKEFIETGTVDLDKWDALIPPEVVPERIERVPLTELVQTVAERLIDIGGARQVKRYQVMEHRQIIDLMPVYDEDGRTGIGAVEVPAFEEVVIPAQVVPREHKMARMFKAMFEDGFDPRDPASYIAKLKSDEALPGMPNRGDWQHNSIGSGELLMRLWLATEMLALVVINHEGRLAALEAGKP